MKPKNPGFFEMAEAIVDAIGAQLYEETTLISVLDGNKDVQLVNGIGLPDVRDENGFHMNRKRMELVGNFVVVAFREYFSEKDGVPKDLRVGKAERNGRVHCYLQVPQGCSFEVVAVREKMEAIKKSICQPRTMNDGVHIGPFDRKVLGVALKTVFGLHRYHAGPLENPGFSTLEKNPDQPGLYDVVFDHDTYSALFKNEPAFPTVLEPAA